MTMRIEAKVLIGYGIQLESEQVAKAFKCKRSMKKAYGISDQHAETLVLVSTTEKRPRYFLMCQGRWNVWGKSKCDYGQECHYVRAYENESTQAFRDAIRAMGGNPEEAEFLVYQWLDVAVLD